MIKKRRVEISKNATESRQLHAEGEPKSFTGPKELPNQIMEEDEEN